ncbi:hypothetical protein HZ994_08835 [Akkermansiaceae bacterium]|nr:hypothetical protein HZ994_08835 [Akkermansiaceae bacterium]
MFMERRISICSLWFLVSAVSPLPAAERTCRVLFLGTAGSAPESLQLFAGKGSQKIELPRMNLSPVYTLPPGDITLFLLENAPEKPEDIPAGSPKAFLAESISDFYLFISDNRENEALPFSMRIIKANPDKFRDGQLLWFNLTGNLIAGEIGTRKLMLRPMARQIMREPAKATGDYPVDIQYRLPGETDSWPLCATKWLHNPSARIIMLILPESGTRIPRIMSFTDFREKPAEQPSSQPGLSRQGQ